MPKPKTFTVARLIRLNPELDDVLVARAQEVGTQPSVLARDLIRKGLASLKPKVGA